MGLVFGLQCDGPFSWFRVCQILSPLFMIIMASGLVSGTCYNTIGRQESGHIVASFK